MKPGTLSIRITTKPYLAQFIKAQYGSPVVLSNREMFGTIVLSLLQKNVCLHKNLNEKHISLRSFTTYFECLAPYTYLKSFGVDLEDDQIIQLNRYFDDEFERQLYQFVQFNIQGDIRYKGYARALYAFCKMYGIHVGDHITFEALKKTEYRFRKNLETKLARFVPSEKDEEIPSILDAKNFLARFVPSQQVHQISIFTT